MRLIPARWWERPCLARALRQLRLPIPTPHTPLRFLDPACSREHHRDAETRVAAWQRMIAQRGQRFERLTSGELFQILAENVDEVCWIRNPADRRIKTYIVVSGRNYCGDQAIKASDPRLDLFYMAYRLLDSQIKGIARDEALALARLAQRRGLHAPGLDWNLLIRHLTESHADAEVLFRSLGRAPKDESHAEQLQREQLRGALDAERVSTPELAEHALRELRVWKSLLVQAAQEERAVQESKGTTTPHRDLSIILRGRPVILFILSGCRNGSPPSIEDIARELKAQNIKTKPVEYLRKQRSEFTRSKNKTPKDLSEDDRKEIIAAIRAVR